MDYRCLSDIPRGGIYDRLSNRVYTNGMDILSEYPHMAVPPEKISRTL